MSIHWGGRGAGHVSRLSTATSGVPALALDFISGALDPRITFTRATTATFVGSNGFIQSAAINVPRFDYDPVTLSPKGLLIEESRSNLHRQSEDFSSPWTATRASAVSAAVQAPSGANSVIAFTEDATNGSSHELYQNTTKAASAITYTYSLYVKKAGRDWICVTIWDNSANGNRFWFNVNTGAKGSTATFGTPFTSATYDIIAAPAGFYRIFVTLTSNTATNLAVTLYSTNADSSFTPAVALNAAGLYVYGSQLEAGAFATSYIPTVAVSLTRNADNAVMTGTNFSSWYNQTQGTFVASADTAAAPAVGARILEASAGVAARVVDLQVVSGPNIQMYNGTASFNAVGTATLNVPFKTAGAYKTADYGVVLNGAAVTTRADALVNTANALQIGRFNSASNYLNGHIRFITYYSTRLLNTQLQTLTQ